DARSATRPLPRLVRLAARSRTGRADARVGAALAAGAAAVTRLFDHAWMLPGALLLAVIAVLLIRAGAARRRARLARYGSEAAIARLAPRDAAMPPRWRAWRLGLAALFLGIAVAGPRWGRSEQTLQVEGVDVAIAMDLSLSMLAADERPSRLERMKQEVRRLRASSPGDRFALIGFAGRS